MVIQETLTPISVAGSTNMIEEYYIEIIKHLQKQNKRLVKMILSLADIQGWATSVSADNESIKTIIQELKSENEALTQQLATLQNQVDTFPTQEQGQQIIQPILDGLHNTAQGQ
jgi:hypothetical protein